MPQRTSQRQRFALALAVVVLAPACALRPPAEAPVHPSSSTEARTLQYLETISVATLGAHDPLVRILAGPGAQTLERPVALAVRDDRMVIADAGNNIIFSYDLKTRHLRQLANAGSYLVGEADDIHIAADQTFFVTDGVGKQVLHFSAAGEYMNRYVDGANLSKPVAVTVDEERDLVLVADELFSHVVVFERHSGKALAGLGRRGNGPGRFRIITDMIYKDDRLYVTDRVEYRLQLLDQDGQYVTHMGQEHLVFPQAMAVTEDGYIFVADRADNRIKVFYQGELVDVIGRNGGARGEFRLVNDMSISNGRLYVADSLNNRIQVFSILGSHKTAEAEALADPGAMVVAIPFTW